MTDIDDLMNDLENTKTTKGKKKKETKVDEKKEEKTVNKKVEEVIKKEEKEIKTNPNLDGNLQDKENNEENENENENENEQENKDNKDDKGAPKKKVVKKVVVKKTGKDAKKDMFLKLAQQQVKANKENDELTKKILLEEKEKKEKEEKEERERIEKEEREEKERRDIEEKKLREEEEERKKLGISKIEYEKLKQKRVEALKLLSSSGINVDGENAVHDKKQPFKKKNKNNNVKEEKKEEVKVINETNKVDDVKETNVQETNDVDNWEDDLDNGTNQVSTKNILINETENIVIEKVVKKKEEEVVQTEEVKEEKRLRSPIICILGHVDTGKTKLLDKLRNTSVQNSEAGGITQQIGATCCPIKNLMTYVDQIEEKEHKLQEIKLPGLLIIDTPGHASFQNLRVRGQSLCDIGIIVIDIMHGLELQTIDSLLMLKEKKTPFVIALNKIDCIYGWKKNNWEPIRSTLKKQTYTVQTEFKKMCENIQTQIVKEVGLNTSLYYENPNMNEYLNIIPTSAITGEGLPDLINMCLYFSQTYLPKKLTFKKNLECSVLEVKVLEKVGTTIDVVVVNGKLKIGDKFIIAGINGPIQSEVKYIMTPQPMKELRIKSEYIYNNEIEGALGCKIFGKNLEDALAGSPLHVYKNDKEAREISNEIKDDCLSFLDNDMLNKDGRGVLVATSSLGSLEALLSYLQEEKIPVSGISLGHIQIKDVNKILTIHNKEKEKFKKINKEDLCILGFDINVAKDAKEYAEKHGVTILTEEIIYRLKDKYVEFEKKCFEERKKEKMKEAIFPVKLKILPKHIFNRSDPIILGVEVMDGVLKKDTPLYCIEKKKVVGTVESLQNNKKEVSEGFKNSSLSIRIKEADKSVAYKTHFDEEDTLIALLTRTSIDRLKEYYSEELQKSVDLANLVREIKTILDIK